MVSLFIARRYLFSKNTRNAVNIISVLSMIVFTLGTAALVVVLSAFNGFELVVNSLNGSYDPDLKIVPAHGKFFEKDSTKIVQLKNIQGVAAVAEILEENALVRYSERQVIARVKGVSNSFFDVANLTGNRPERKISSMNKVLAELDDVKARITDGDSQPTRRKDFAIVGRGLGQKLGVDFRGTENLTVFVPRTEVDPMLPAEGFAQNSIYPSHEFAVQQDVDGRTILVPIDFMKALLESDSKLSGLEIRVNDESQIGEVKEKIKNILGKDFQVKDHFEQNELHNRVMKSEKLASYIILSFILLIASFNMVASLIMLVIEKRDNIRTLFAMGGNKSMIRSIFLGNGMLISIMGTGIGLILGFGLCWLQMQYGLIKIGSADTLVISSYPVEVRISDFVIVAITSLVLGLLSSIYPAAKAGNSG